MNKYLVSGRKPLFCIVVGWVERSASEAKPIIRRVMRKRWVSRRYALLYPSYGFVKFSVGHYLRWLALLVALGLLGNAVTGCYYLGQKGNLYLPDETQQTGKQKSASTSR